MRTLRILLCLGLGLGSAPVCPAEAPAQAPGPWPRRVAHLHALGEVRIPAGTQALGTTLGGLSGLTYDTRRCRWYAISDDRSQVNPARFYTLCIDASDGRLEAQDVRVTHVTTLTDRDGNPFPPKSLDTEGIALSASGESVFVSSEGDPRSGELPWIKEFGLDGRERRSLGVPERYLPGPGRGVRVNLGFEPLARSPDGRTLITAVENALAQDGPEADLERGTRCRVLFLDTASGNAVRECALDLEPVARPPAPPQGHKTNGLPEVLALDDAGTLLALERSFSEGAGATVRLYEVHTREASDTSSLPALARADGSYLPLERRASKRLLLDVADIGVVPDNLEAMALGPRLPDGRRLLILLSDDNFSPLQVTQLLALALTEAPAPAAPAPPCPDRRR